MAKHFTGGCWWWEGDALEQRHFFELPVFATDHAGLQPHTHTGLELSADSLNLAPAAGEGEDRTPTRALPA